MARLGIEPHKGPRNTRVLTAEEVQDITNEYTRYTKMYQTKDYVEEYVIDDL